MENMHSIHIAPFDAQFEDIHIFVTNLAIVKISGIYLEAFPPASPFTNIWHNLSLSGFTGSKDLIGELYIFFRNQGQDQRLALSLDCRIRARPIVSQEPANTFCKAVQFFFEWTNKWVKDNNVVDGNNSSFIMPEFLYSKAHFEQDLPE